MKIVFIGTVESSYEALSELIENDVKIEAIFTQESNTYNSDYKSLRPLAEKKGIEVFSIKNINDFENIEKLSEINPDIIFVIGISQIIGNEIVKIPKYGCIGFHPTLLPKGRGRAAIPWTILNEETETGVTLFYINEGIDTGDIIVQERIVLHERENARTLYDKLMVALRSVIKNNLENVLNNEISATKQNDYEATYYCKRVKQDGLIDWSISALEIDRLIRATTKPYPGAFTSHKGEQLIIWSSELVEKDNFSAVCGQRVEILENIGVKVKTGDGIILIKEVEYRGEIMNSSKLFKVVGNKFM